MCCHGSARLSHYQITPHTLTWIPIGHTYTSWATKAHTSSHSRSPIRLYEVCPISFVRSGLSMSSLRYMTTPTLYTYLLCLLQCYLLCFAPPSSIIVVTQWILHLFIIGGVCCPPSLFPDLLENRKQSNYPHHFKNYSISIDTHLPLPSAPVAVNKDPCLHSNLQSESPSLARVLC